MAVTNWLYLALTSCAFIAAALIGWGDAGWAIKAAVLAASLMLIVAARYVLAPKLSFQYLLFARASIWVIVFVIITSGMISASSAGLTRLRVAAVLFAGVLGVFATSLMTFLAIGKPCPVCDGRSPIQFIKGPIIWAGTDSFQLRFLQSGVASQCPVCNADWPFTESELREARKQKP